MSKVRVFVDANVWYSAAYKSTGHARQLISGVVPDIILITSQRMLSDARKSLDKNAPSRLNVLETLITALAERLKILPNPSQVDVLKEHEVVSDFDDAIVVAGAREANADYLVTWNTKDFIQKNIPDIKIITPAELIKIMNKG